MISKRARAHLFAHSQIVSSIAIQHKEIDTPLDKETETNTSSFICTQSNGFKYFNSPLEILFNINGFKSSKWLNSSIWPIDGTLTGATSPDQSETRSNSNEGVLCTCQSSRTRVSPSNAVRCHKQDSHYGGFIHLLR